MNLNIKIGKRLSLVINNNKAMMIGVCWGELDEDFKAFSIAILFIIFTFDWTKKQKAIVKIEPTNEEKKERLLHLIERNEQYKINITKTIKEHKEQLSLIK